MQKRSHPTAADYAVIAVSPFLIFLMITGLANFVVLLFYHGSFPARVNWNLFFYTMGAVAVSRVAIEQTRNYAYGYALALGIAGFIGMSGMFGSALFTLAIILLISFLADRIVYDCTLIDESADSSGQGLIDVGRDLVKSHTKKSSPPPTPESPAETTAPDAVTKSRRKKPHQPGRTVLWLAFGALPLFGLGQFFFRGSSFALERGNFYLSMYLFASLSLLVTTSFLGLRRYLRQRGAEMPANVTVAWLAVGLVSILAILFTARLAPVPGQLLASFRLPDLAESRTDRQASRYGFGNEGAKQTSPDDAKANQPDQGQDAPPSGQTQKGAKPGQADGGDAKDAPPGKQSGGKKSGGGDSKKESSKSDSDAKPNPDSAPSQPQPSSSSKSEPSKSDQPKSESDNKNQPRPKDPAESDPSGESNSNDQQTPPQQTPPDKSDQQPDADDPANPQSPDSENAANNNTTNKAIETISNALPDLTGILKFIVFVALLGVIIFYVWKNYDALLAWWNSLFAPPSTNSNGEQADTRLTVPEEPSRPFSSFNNPIGRETDSRRTIIITFQAFEAWAREQGWSRTKDETPSEFLRRITVELPQSSRPASQLVDAYNRIVYGRGNANQSDINAATSIWKMMTNVSSAL